MRSAVALLGVVIVTAVHAQSLPPGPLPESPRSSIGYSSVAEALAALKAKPGTEVRIERGWTIVADRESASERTLWAFTPPEHLAHPAAVKRIVVERDGAIYLDMKVLCQAKKKACDQLVREFQALNDGVRQQLVPAP